MIFLPVHEIKLPRQYAKLGQTVFQLSTTVTDKMCFMLQNDKFAFRARKDGHEIWEVTPLVQIGTGESVEMREHLTSNKHRVQYARQKDLDSK